MRREYYRKSSSWFRSGGSYLPSNVKSFVWNSNWLPHFNLNSFDIKKVHSISGRFEKIEQYTFAFSKLSLNQRILVTCSKKRLPYHIISYLHNTIQKCSFFSSHYWCYCCHLSKLLRANGFCRLNESEIITHRQRHKVVAINVSYISIHTLTPTLYLFGKFQLLHSQKCQDYFTFHNYSSFIVKICSFSCI